MKQLTHTRAKTHQARRQPGHILVAVLVLMVVGITITTMALAVLVTSSQSLGGAMEADRISAAVEGGVENAILSVLRNPSYSGEENLEIGGLLVDIEVTQGAQTTIRATAASGNYSQRYQVVLERIGGVLTVTSWQQID